MADKTIITRWLLSHKDELKLSFTEYSWGHPSLFDISVIIEQNGFVHRGRGTHHESNIALEKASAEAVERFCCWNLNLSTVGCAVHSEKQACEENSIREFIERYIFNEFLNNSLLIKPLIVSSKMMGNGSHYDPEVQFWHFDQLENTSVVLSMCLEKSEPISMGLAAGPLTLAIEKSYIEAIRNYKAYLEDPHGFVKEATSNKNLWCCDKVFLQKIIQKINLPSNVKNYAIPETETITIPVSDIIPFKDCPLFFSYSNQVVKNE